jgi:AraC-like DNA-binding protein
MQGIREVKTIAGRRGPRRRHEHEDHSVALVWSGATQAEASGRLCAAGAGQAVLIAAGAPHECSPLSPADWSYTLLLVRPGTCPALDEILAAAEGGLLVADTPPGLASRLAAAAVAEAEAEALAELALLAGTLEDRGSGLDATASSRRYAHRSAGQDGSSASSARAFERAEALLRASIERGASLDEIAREARMDKYELVRGFKAAYGLSPHAYLLNLRIDEAKARLRAGQNAAQTALACGFCDQSHFSRVFERTVGLPPAAYIQASAQERTRPGEPRRPSIGA